MSKANTYSRIIRWIFAFIIFGYLWREGGYWRYVSYIGIAIAAVIGILLVIVVRRHQER
jgi:uncharacterized membrane protein YccC